jgi:ABC-type multidrug transport system ATPase subunit
MAIEVEGVTKTYGAVRALVNVSATFPSGRVSAVLGANGSGKSTLLSIVGTLATPTVGRVRHGDLGATREAVRAGLGWLGHESLCYGDLTGRENLMFAARLHGAGRDRVDRVVERFGVGAFADRPFSTYSRGQRQRVSLARALVHEPRLLLFDEPTTGLDAAGIARLTDVIREEIGRGVTLVIVTHDAAFATIAHRTVTLDRGRVVGDVSRETGGAPA